MLPFYSRICILCSFVRVEYLWKKIALITSFTILLISPKVMKKYDESAVMKISQVFGTL